MKPRPRLRKAVKWGSAAASVVLLTAWIGSGWWIFGCQRYPGYGVWLSAGSVGVSYAVWSFEGSHTPFFFPPRKIDPVRVPQFDWWYVHSENIYGWSRSIPLWPFAATALIATTVMWRHDAVCRRLARSGRCVACGYDRTGLSPSPDAACPECGSASE